MLTRNQYIILAVLLVTSFAFGRYATPEKVKVETKTVTVEVEKKVEVAHVITKIVEVKKPDGTSTTETTTVTDTNTNTSSTNNTNIDSIKETIKSSSVLNISGLASIDALNPTSITYGVSINKQLIGPITFGLFGFTDKKVGVSIGLNF